MQTACIIIPCYNEAERFEFDTYLYFIEKNTYSFYFVNDGSTDNTSEVLKHLQQQNPEKINILELKKNIGKGAAIREGILKCLPNNFEYLGFLDADLATPLEEIPFLMNYFQNEYKVVTGARVKRLGSHIKRSLSRHYMGRIFATISSFTLKIKMYDSQCGAKIFDKNIAEILFKKPFSTKWLFDLELIYRLKKHDPEDFNKNIIEVPLRVWTEKYNSRLTIYDFIKAPFELLAIRKS